MLDTYYDNRGTHIPHAPSPPCRIPPDPALNVKNCLVPANHTWPVVSLCSAPPRGFWALKKPSPHPNQRPSTDHVSWGPMRGLKKSYMKRGHETERQKDGHHDSMKESAKGRFFESHLKYEFAWPHRSIISDTTVERAVWCSRKMF